MAKTLKNIRKMMMPVTIHHPLMALFTLDVSLFFLLIPIMLLLISVRCLKCFAKVRIILGRQKGKREKGTRITPKTAQKCSLNIKKSLNICFIAGIGMSLIDIYKADNKTRESARQVGGWAGAYAGGRIGSSIGARAGMTIAIAVGQAGPQITTPEELLTVPVFGAIGGISGGIVGSVSGFFFGATATEKIHDWIFTPLEKEEWEIACEK